MILIWIKEKSQQNKACNKPRVCYLVLLYYPILLFQFSMTAPQKEYFSYFYQNLIVSYPANTSATTATRQALCWDENDIQLSIFPLCHGAIRGGCTCSFWKNKFWPDFNWVFNLTAQTFSPEACPCLQRHFHILHSWNEHHRKKPLQQVLEYFLAFTSKTHLSTLVNSAVPVPEPYSPYSWTNHSPWCNSLPLIFFKLALQKSRIEPVLLSYLNFSD